MKQKLFLFIALLLAAGCAPASSPTDADPAALVLPSLAASSATPEITETDSTVPAEIEAENLVTFDEMGIAVGFD
ncbi:MAG: hypothetical protein EDM79_20140, partial [Chloroflexi bacterium]